MLVALLYVTVAGAGEPPAVATVKEDGVSVEMFIARENVAVTAPVSETNVLPFVGVTPVTVGEPSVVKLQELGEPSGVPSAAETVPASVAVYVVFGVSAAVGVSVAVRDGVSYVTVAGICPLAPLSVNVVPVIEGTYMSRANVARIEALIGTVVEPAAGEVAMPGGAGAVAAVVNDHESVPARPTPSAALVIAGVSVAVYAVPSARGAWGTSVAVKDDGSYETVAGTLPLGPLRVKLDVVTVVGSRAWSKDACRLTPGLTPVAEAAGNVPVRPGG